MFLSKTYEPELFLIKKLNVVFYMQNTSESVLTVLYYKCKSLFIVQWIMNFIYHNSMNIRTVMILLCSSTLYFYLCSWAMRSIKPKTSLISNNLTVLLVLLLFVIIAVLVSVCKSLALFNFALSYYNMFNFIKYTILTLSYIYGLFSFLENAPNIWLSIIQNTPVSFFGYLFYKTFSYFSFSLLAVASGFDFQVFVEQILNRFFVRLSIISKYMTHHFFLVGFVYITISTIQSIFIASIAHASSHLYQTGISFFYMLVFSIIFVNLLLDDFNKQHASCLYVNFHNVNQEPLYLVILNSFKITFSRMLNSPLMYLTTGVCKFLLEYNSLVLATHPENQKFNTIGVFLIFVIKGTIFELIFKHFNCAETYKVVNETVDFKRADIGNEQRKEEIGIFVEMQYVDFIFNLVFHVFFSILCLINFVNIEIFNAYDNKSTLFCKVFDGTVQFTDLFQCLLLLMYLRGAQIAFITFRYFGIKLQNPDDAKERLSE